VPNKPEYANVLGFIKYAESKEKQYVIKEDNMFGKVDIVIRVKIEVSEEVAEALEMLNKVNMKKLFFTSFLNTFTSSSPKEAYNRMLNFAVASSNLFDNSGGVILPQTPIQMPVNSQNIPNVETSSNLDTQPKKIDEKLKDDKKVEKIESNIMGFEKNETKEDSK
jgi:hypothetical protein